MSDTKKEVCFTVSNVGLQGKPTEPSSIKKAVEGSVKKGIRFTVSGNNGNLIEGKIVNSLPREIMDQVNHKAIGAGKHEPEQTSSMVILQEAEPEDIGQLHSIQEAHLESNSAEDGEDGFDTVHVLVESDGSAQQVVENSNSASACNGARNSLSSKEDASRASNAKTGSMLVSQQKAQNSNLATVHTDKENTGLATNTNASGSQVNTGATAQSQKPKDFTFILKTDSIQKRNFTYNKISFQCFHCKYKTASKTALGKHMDKIHPSVFDVHKDLDIKHTVTSVASENSKIEVLTMSEYEKTLKPKRGRKPGSGTKRKRGIEKQDIPGVFNCNQCDKVR